MLSPFSILYLVVSSSSQSVSLTNTIIPGLTEAPCTNISSFSFRCFLFNSSINLSIVQNDSVVFSSSKFINFLPSNIVSRPPLYIIKLIYMISLSKARGFRLFSNFYIVKNKRELTLSDIFTGAQITVIVRPNYIEEKNISCASQSWYENLKVFIMTNYLPEFYSDFHV